jgi:hypothetical protein
MTPAAEFPTLFDDDELENLLAQRSSSTAAPRVRSEPGHDGDERCALEQRFPHVVVRIVATWGHPECSQYLRSLLVEDRGGSRQGFPRAAHAELMLLDFVHARLLHEERMSDSATQAVEAEAKSRASGVDGWWIKR